MSGSGESGNGHVALSPVEQFEEAFMGCLAAITKEDTLTNVDKNEITMDVNQGIANVMEHARSMESYFLKKRLEIAAHKPELLIKDECNEFRLELVRKDELLKKHYEKINHWQAILSDVQGGGGGKLPVGGPGSNQSGPPSHPGTVSQGPMSQGPPTPHTPMGMSQGPHTPHTPGPMTPGRPNTPGRMQSNIGYSHSPSMHQQPMGSPMGPGGGLQGPLAYLEKSASGIGMGDNR